MMERRQQRGMTGKTDIIIIMVIYYYRETGASKQPVKVNR